jgi:hypothetical protein
MGAFFSKYSFLVIWVCVIIIVGALFVLVVQPSLHFGSTAPTTSNNGSAPAVAPVVVPPTPSVTLTIEKLKTGNTLLVQWQNLPANTTALDIFRSAKNSTSSWSLWKTLSLTPGELGEGNDSIAFGDTSYAGYSFYVEAVNENGTSTTSGNGSGSNPTILWTSSAGIPPVTTSTTPGAPDNGNNNGTPPSNGTSTPSSTSPVTPPPSSPSSTAPTSNPSQTPSGTPYYNPEVQVQGYGSAQTDNFWVQYVDKNIEIGWQNLPPTVDNVVVVRSLNEAGPWTTVFVQQNPDVSTAYSIQVVDDTLGSPYYYELNANEASTTIATFGPVYLSGSSQ